MNNYPKFQYSFFIEGKDTPQIVIRGENFMEFILDIEKTKTHFEKRDLEKPDIADVSMCTIHNIVMKENWQKIKKAQIKNHFIICLDQRDINNFDSFFKCLFRFYIITF